VAEPDPQRTLAEAAAAEPAASSAAPILDRIPSDAATVGSEEPPLAALQGLSPSGVAVPATSEGLPRGFGSVGEPASEGPLQGFGAVGEPALEDPPQGFGAVGEPASEAPPQGFGEVPPQGFGAVGEPAPAAEEPTVGCSAFVSLFYLGS